MYTIRFEMEKEPCRKLWQRLVPEQLVTDLWGVRDCFYRNYREGLLFIVAEERGEPVGFLPLCRIQGTEVYGFFPGEHWKGRTWLEQNRIIAKNADVLQAMLDWLNGRGVQYDLRYLVEPSAGFGLDEVDEVGYLFQPASQDYDMQTYYSCFSSRKSLKSILKEIERFEQRGLYYRLNYDPDFDWMIRQNREGFGEQSYFWDASFEKSFRELSAYLQRKGLLQLTALLVEEKIAAVDFGCVYNNVYTLLAGATNPEFLGIAKVINMHHIKRSCEERFDSVDFLCGDFSWKKIFQLTPRPLFQISNCVNQKQAVSVLQKEENYG